MKSSDGFYQYVMEDLFGTLEGISSKRMFGGFGFYKDGIIFGIIADGKLHFKVGEGNKKDFEKARSKPFEYAMKNGKTNSISYWELPEFVMEDKELLARWVNKAVEESLKSKKK